MKKEVFCFLTLLIFVGFISFSSAFWPFDNFKTSITGNVAGSSQCTVSSGVQTLLDSDFNQEGKTARTLVLGDAVGTFNEDTYVLIDCNVNNVQPAPLEKTIKARLTYSSTTLAYREYCYYLKPEVETRYDVSATLYPNNQACVSASERSHVIVPGFGKASENVIKQECGIDGARECSEGAKCKSPTVSDGYGKCASCPAKTTYKDGKCISTEEQKDVTQDSKAGQNEKQICPADMRWGDNGCTPVQNPAKYYGETPLEEKDKENEDDKIPSIPKDEDFFELKLEKGWNLIGLPFIEGKFIETTCDLSGNYKSYIYDTQDKNYRKIPASQLLKNSNTLEGRGIWFKSPSSCNIRFSGLNTDGQSISLFSGWNLISVQSSEFTDLSKAKGDCEISSAFWSYDSNSVKYKKAKSLEKGKGYWVKVKSSCTLNSNGDDMPPGVPK